MPTNETRRALGDAAARQLANTTKTPPQLSSITPRWLVQLLSWVPVESGTYRVNQVKNESDIEVACGTRDERKLPETFVDYIEKPREYTLSAISTIVDVHTRISDLFSHPHDQIREQLRLTAEKVKERLRRATRALDAAEIDAGFLGEPPGKWRGENAAAVAVDERRFAGNLRCRRRRS